MTAIKNLSKKECFLMTICIIENQNHIEKYNNLLYNKNKNKKETYMINLTDDRYKFIFKLSYHISANASENEKFQAAVKTAYTTFCRTIKFDALKTLTNTKKTKIKTHLKALVANEIKNSLDELKNKPELSQEIYDRWHCETRKKIIDIYKNNEYSIELYHGQAQKWLNITLKHLYVMNLPSYKWIYEGNIKQFLHVAVDTIITKRANEKLNIEKPSDCWSSWNENAYQNYQKELREKIQEANKDAIPFEWEFDSWDITEDND